MVFPNEYIFNGWPIGGATERFLSGQLKSSTWHFIGDTLMLIQKFTMHSCLRILKYPSIMWRLFQEEISKNFLKDVSNY